MASADLWNKALQTLSSDETQSIATLSSGLSKKSVVDDVLQAARTKRDTVHSKRWKYKRSDGSVVIVRDVFEKIIQWVTKYATAVDVVANVEPMYINPVWAVVRFLLQASTSDAEAFGCLSEGIEIVTDVMARYALLEKIIAPDASCLYSDELAYLDQCIVKLYAAVLTYLSRASKFWSENTAQRMFKAVFQRLEVESKALQAAVSKADDEAFRTVSLVQTRILVSESGATRRALSSFQRETQAPIVRTAQIVSNLHDNLLKSERQKVFRWISTVPCESQHLEASKKILQGTGRWLLDRAELLAWQRSSSSAIFWLHAVPGAGKSKLTSIVIEALLEQQRVAKVGAIPLAYFYCSKKSSDPRTADPVQILRALLRQLTGRDSALPLRGGVAQEYQLRQERAEETGAQLADLDSDEVIQYILDITAEDPVVLVIDALDEANYEQRGTLFDALRRIVEESHNLVKIFVSSRNDGDIVDEFEQWPNLEIGDKFNRNDVNAFTIFKVDQAIKARKILRGNVSVSLRDDIIKTLTGKAQGMFRWVELSVETLSSSRRLAVEKDVRSELGMLPAELKNQYLVIYNDILGSGPATAAIARRAFSWMLAAWRPLTVEEFISAVALDDHGEYHHGLDTSSLLDICRNFVTTVSLDSASRTMSFQWAHLSVKEFLEGLPDFCQEQIHTVAVSRCLADFHSKSWLYTGIPEGGMKAFDGLRDYTVYLFQHAAMSELQRAESTTALSMKEFLFDHLFKPTLAYKKWNSINRSCEESLLLQDSKDVPSYIQDMQLDDGDGILAVCEYGLLSVLHILGDLELVPWKNYSRRPHSTPLYAATSNGKFAIAKWLLEHKVFDVDEIHEHVTPLYDAVWTQDHDLVALLLEHGADPLSIHDKGISGPLHRAIEVKDINIFEALVRKVELMHKDEPNVASKVGFDWKLEALYDALRNNWSEATQALIWRGVDIYSRSSRADGGIDESTTLQIAVEYAEETIVSSLLEASLQRARSKTPSKIGGLWKTGPEAHELYLYATDEVQRSALHYLVQRKGSQSDDSEAIMSMLLRYGVDPSITSNKGVTALHVAASIGSEDTVQQLVAKNVNLEAETKNGQRAIHFAAGSYHPTIIQYLVNQGVDPTARDQNSRTPLHYAAARGNVLGLEVLSKVLLNLDDQPRRPDEFQSHQAFTDRLSVVDNKGESLLHVVGSYWSQEDIYDQIKNESDIMINRIESTVQFLLERRIDINRRADDGSTRLISLISLPSGLSASLYSAVIAAKELLANGADPNIPDLQGKTPLHHAAVCFWEEPVENLLQAGANIHSADHEGSTPLHIACTTPSDHVMRLLLQGADHTLRDSEGATPLHRAAEIDDPANAVMLLMKGASPHIVDNSGASPLHWAAKAGRSQLVRRLLRAGASPHSIDQSGNSPMQYAAKYASILTEDIEEDEDREYMGAWFRLHKASEEICARHNTRPRMDLKRSQSLLLRIDRSWGDFSDFKRKEVEGM